LAIVKPWQGRSPSSPTYPWTAVYDTPASSSFSSAVMTNDGGAVVVGQVSPLNEPDASQAVITRYGADGHLAWANTYDDDNSKYQAVAVTADGTIIAVGYTSSSTNTADALISAFSPTGSIKWTKTYGGSGDDSFASVASAADGTIIVAGNTTSTDGDFPITRGSMDGVLAGITPSGTIMWAKTYGGSPGTSFESMAIAPDGTILVAGESGSTNGDFPVAPGDGDAIVAAFSPTGVIRWVTHGTESTIAFWSLAVTPQGNIIVAGGGYSLTESSVASLSPTGHLNWSTTYNDLDTVSFQSVATTPDGNIIVVGDTTSTDATFTATHGGHDALVATLGPTGNVIWAKTYGGTGDDKFNAATVASDGTILAVGVTASANGDFPVPSGTSQAVAAALTPDGGLH